jgi:hypothetical protein
MRLALVGVAWLALAGAAVAEDSPACAKFTNDFEFNACLAKQGPKAGVTHATGAPAFDAPAGRGSAGPLVTRTKHGRMQAIFDIAPKK